ncbi:AAA family ATPase [Kiloniella sp.]|uniref:AAA family ATPase n=1 Tax=Kiloniella sp. TaxID=1938587 RepID=UPI003A8D9B85
MTLFNPNLQVQALTVFARGTRVFDEKFHSGLNIIRGENSSGKSTIMDFLFFALGGDLLEHQWRETALLCDTVFVGVKLNGSDITLRRSIEPKSSRPMQIYFGPIEGALEKSEDGWESYSFRRGKAESFSQVMFRLLGFPEVQYGEANTKITINQILRLVYSDQLSSVEKILRNQSFDDAITRETVGNLLLGAFDDQYYEARLRLRAADSEVKEVITRINFLTRTHARDGHPLTSEWLSQEAKRLVDELDKLNNEITTLEEKIFNAQFDDRLTLNDQNETYARVKELQEKLGKLIEERDELEIQIADSDAFIISLNRKLEALQQSKVIVDELNTLEFDFCPSCLAPVSKEQVEGACTLCKQASDSEHTKERSLRLINEYARQKQNSFDLQGIRKNSLMRLNSEIVKTHELWEQASRHYSVSLRSPTTELRSRLRKLNRDAGYAQRELEELASRKAIITELQEAREQRDNLNSEIEKLKAQINFSERRSQEQIIKARKKVEECCLEFLHQDLERQSTFVDANRVNFEFDGDRISVNDESYFSASSMVYLRNSFFASLALASANDKSFYHPRFLLMDTVEDKGLEPERSKNFQRLLHEKCSTAKSDMQIIIATSMIAEELNTPEITVGEYFTHTNRTLKFIG